jgi:hypothetical protein
MSTRRGQIGLYAMVAAFVSIVFAPLMALSYLATPEGAEGLEMEIVRAWAEPARDLAGGLLTFASPGRVYSTYLQLFALLFPAVVLCALAVRSSRSRDTRRRAERWGWRIALPGYALSMFGLATIAILLIGMDPSAGIIDTIFVATLFPGMILALIGTSVLGIGLVRAGYEPRATAWLLAFAFPLGVTGSILGHNSLGMVPVFIAWGLTGRRLREEDASESVPEGSLRLTA